MKHNDKSESLQKRGGVTRFDMSVCSQWIASIIAHYDELLLVEIVADKNTDITVGYSRRISLS